MKRDEALASLQNFSTTGNEAADVNALYALIERMGELTQEIGIRREMFMIFERNPNADLGSPGPIVHALEKSPIDEHVTLLSEALKREATVMTVWMAERCFRSNLVDDNRRCLIESLQIAATRNSTGEVATAIDEALENYGG